jgi:hypothetical protein
MAAKQRGVTVSLDKTAELTSSIKKLTSTKLFVGIPQESSHRSDGKLSNAELGYIHENGAPEVNIPPRPFLHPGVRKIQDSVIAPGMKIAGQEAFNGNWAAAERALSIIGQKAVESVKDTITAGIPPPLKAATVAGRVRRTARYRAASTSARARLQQRAREGAVPLIDTGQLIRSITWVIRKD